MPKEVKETKKESNPGIIVMAGEIETSDFDSLPWDVKLKDYTNMRDGDEIINTCLTAVKLPIERSDFRIEPGCDSDIAKEAAEYVDWQFRNMKGGYQRFKRHCLIAVDFGLSLFEKIYKRGVKYHNGEKNKTTNIIYNFSAIANDTIDEFLYDREANFTGIKHEKRIPEYGNQTVNIKSEKLFKMSYNEEYNDVRGRSLLRPIREIWNYRKKILNATTRASQRGAGIPIASVYGDVNASTKAKAKEMLRTMGNADNAYGIEQKGKIEIRLEELKNQQNNIPLIEILNRGIFFNSLTQFMTSGLGQNGSRAATSELKSTFEMAASANQQWLEEGMQRITDEMIDISYLANISKEDRPIFKYDAISQVDLSKASVDIKNLLDSGAITKDESIEGFVRSLFDLPDIQKATTQIAVEESEEESVTKIQEEEGLSQKPKVITLDRQKNLDRAKEIFEFDSANEHFMSTQSKVEKITDEMIGKIFTEIKTQLKDDRMKNIYVRYSREFVNKLTDVFDDGFKRGQKDFTKELKKIGATEIKLNRLARKQKTIRRGLERAVKQLGVKIRASVERSMEQVTDEYIIKVGGVNAVLDKIQETGFKRARRELITETELGYSEGRKDVILDSKGLIDDYIYSAQLDVSLCDECGPLDGEIFTGVEIESGGWGYSQPINPTCLGGAQCRCQWVPNTATNREQVLGG